MAEPNLIPRLHVHAVTLVEPDEHRAAAAMARLPPHHAVTAGPTAIAHVHVTRVSVAATASPAGSGGSHATHTPSPTLQPTSKPTHTAAVQYAQPTRTVAVMVVGETRGMLDGGSQALRSAHHLTKPLLAEFGEGNVHVYICVEAPSAARAQKVVYGSLRPTKAFEHVVTSRHEAVHPQYVRLSLCYESVKAFATTHGLFNYEWFFRVRPDTVFFTDMATPLASLPFDAISAPMRMIGGSRMGAVNPRDDIWAYADTACENHNACAMMKWTETGFEQDRTRSDTIDSCIMVTDQLAAVPYLFAETYFKAAMDQGATLPLTTRAFPVLDSLLTFGLPEGRFTVRLLAAGARLAVLRVQARITKMANLRNSFGGGMCTQPFCADPTYAEFNVSGCTKPTSKESCMASVARGIHVGHGWWVDDRKCIHHKG